jgi:hypothetical protein
MGGRRQQTADHRQLTAAILRSNTCPYASQRHVTDADRCMCKAAAQPAGAACVLKARGNCAGEQPGACAATAVSSPSPYCWCRLGTTRTISAKSVCPYAESVWRSRKRPRQGFTVWIEQLGHGLQGYYGYPINFQEVGMMNCKLRNLRTSRKLMENP